MTWKLEDEQAHKLNPSSQVIIVHLSTPRLFHAEARTSQLHHTSTCCVLCSQGHILLLIIKVWKNFSTASGWLDAFNLNQA